MTREQKIEKLIDAVLATGSFFDVLDDEYVCPLCKSMVNKSFLMSMDDIEHAEDCPYRLAKDIKQ